jgi:hypothetical protein
METYTIQYMMTTVPRTALERLLPLPQGTVPAFVVPERHHGQGDDKGKIVGRVV